MDRPLVALVMAGGVGTRLYPASRNHRPKQFLRLGGDDSLLAQTVDRVGFADEVFVSTRPEFADEVSSHAPGVDVIVEPAGKDTGPALVYATHRIRERVGECVVLATPSDHHVEGAFESIARTGARVAVETKGLVTFGVEPSRPDPGYGYIEPEAGEEEYSPVRRFREKPSRTAASRYVERGFYWNSGVFAVTPDALLREARTSSLAPLVEALAEGEPERGFAAVDAVSVDRAIAERSDEVYVVPADLEWDDVGSWDSLARIVERDVDGNAIVGECLTIDARGNVVASDDKHVSVLGLSDVVVAAYDDRVLVVPKAAAQRVREVVATLRENESVEDGSG